MMVTAATALRAQYPEQHIEEYLILEAAGRVVLNTWEAAARPRRPEARWPKPQAPPPALPLAQLG